MKPLLYGATALIGLLSPALLVPGCSDCPQRKLLPGTYLPITGAEPDYKLVWNEDGTIIESYTTPAGQHFELQYTAGPYKAGF